ncbi:MAG: L-fucokinase [bacterium]|nr:L-fucokinase [bacterium]
MSPSPFWTGIVVTAANALQAQAYQHELETLQRQGIISDQTLLLAVPDPSSERVGSGGATLNALLTVTEYLSARAGLSFIDPELLRTSRLLIIHSGGDSRRIPCSSVCGKAFSTLPAVRESGTLASPFLILLEKMTEICQSAEAGLFVASGDVLLLLPEMEYDWSHSGVTGLAIPAGIEFGTKHGVYALQEGSNQVETFLQKATFDQLQSNHAIRKNQTVLLDSGIVYFCGDTTTKILTLNVLPPLDACTYLGVDSGAVPLRIELYSDILLGMAARTEKETYMAMESSAKDLSALHRAREQLWQTLRPLSFQAIVAENGLFAHLGTTKETIDLFVQDSPFRRPFGLHHTVRSYVEEAEVAGDAVVINSMLFGPGRVDTGAVIEHSKLQGNWSIGAGAFCSSLRSYYGLHVEPEMVIKELCLQPGKDGQERRIVTLYGVFDQIKDTADDPKATFANRPWQDFLTQSEISREELWPGLPECEHTLWNARLFPILFEGEWLETVLWLQYNKKPSSHILRKWRTATRLSFSDILQEADPMAEFGWIRTLAHQLDLHHVESTLLDRQNHFLLPIFKQCAMEGHWDVLEIMDSIAQDSPSDIAARSFSSIADTLAAFSKNQGGLRSGPMRNIEWKDGFALLQQNNRKEAVRLLSRIRKDWLQSPERLIRAARHYEGAAQVLIRQSVETAPLWYEREEPSCLGEWIHADIPARIDLAGGWTDTPPITYEHGGIVVNMGVQIDGERPIGAKVRRIAEPVLLFQSGEDDRIHRCTTLDDLRDYAQPLAPGALCKTILLAIGLVSLESPQSLEQQLTALGGGIEIHTYSNLPTGSGLGTSSILAAAIVAALGRVTGRRMDMTSLIHAVLHIEQRLTTGGGWQDQVGGLLPGIKISRSTNTLPLQVTYEPLALDASFLNILEQHSLLIYTGRTRLARNLLQDVIRRWYARVPEMVENIQAMTTNAEAMASALYQGDLDHVGRCLTTYWEQKKKMAGGTEPAHVSRMFTATQPFTLGHSLAGAGGGGFMLLLVRNPQEKEVIQSILEKSFQSYRVTTHAISIDPWGLVVH